ncbi:MAG: rhodanese-like domain-containing protein [Ferruginibacter sp.]|nr:rhodanese-like domain-containing protein [Ferruginibacter sp.]
MKKIKFSLAAIICTFSFVAMATTVFFRKALVDFDAFEKVATEAKKHRASRLVNVDEFLKMSKETGTIILDARSEAMFKAKHVKGAINLNFSDFNVESLQAIIPNNATRILIYCNNNFEDKPVFLKSVKVAPFVSKMALPTTKFKQPVLTQLASNSQLTLALNIPTYINLYGYGYRNVYELNELVNTSTDTRIEFEGTLIRK